jgi:hypothetical protein
LNRGRRSLGTFGSGKAQCARLLVEQGSCEAKSQIQDRGGVRWPLAFTRLSIAWIDSGQRRIEGAISEARGLAVHLQLAQQEPRPDGATAGAERLPTPQARSFLGAEATPAHDWIVPK